MPTDVEWASNGLEQAMLDAAKASGGFQLFDNPSFFLLHVFQSHWMPDLWCFVSSMQTKGVTDNARIQFNRFETAVNKCITHFRLAMCDFLENRTNPPKTHKASTTFLIWNKRRMMEMADENVLVVFKQNQELRKFLSPLQQSPLSKLRLLYFL